MHRLEKVPGNDPHRWNALEREDTQRDAPRSGARFQACMKKHCDKGEPRESEKEVIYTMCIRERNRSHTGESSELRQRKLVFGFA